MNASYNLEWLNGLICLVVAGDYVTFFVDNPDLQELSSKNIDDVHWIEISHKLNDNQELVSTDSHFHFDELIQKYCFLSD